MAKNKIIERIAQRIRHLRKLKKISQEILAEKAEIHPTLVGKIERAEINPTIVTLEKIASAFEITLSQLFDIPQSKDLADSDVDALNKAIKLLQIAIEEAKKIKK